jgi:hypothetical protein
MASQTEDNEISNVRRVNELLRQALAQCEKLLTELENASRKSDQDNDPPSPASPA